MGREEAPTGLAVGRVLRERNPSPQPREKSSGGHPKGSRARGGRPCRGCRIHRGTSCPPGSPPYTPALMPFNCSHLPGWETTSSHGQRRNVLAFNLKVRVLTYTDSKRGCPARTPSRFPFVEDRGCFCRTLQSLLQKNLMSSGPGWVLLQLRSGDYCSEVRFVGCTLAVDMGVALPGYCSIISCRI